MASSRRTRSQLVLPDFSPNQLARSPLKDARQAVRNNPSPQANSLSLETDPRLFSPLNKQPKRPSSSFKDASTHERDSKRTKYDDSREENRSPLLGPRRPPSAASVRETAPLDTPSKSRRAQSVPIWPSAPLIDLNHVPRSPSKPPPVLRIAALPAEEAQPLAPTARQPLAQTELSNRSSLVPILPCTPEHATSPPASPSSPLTSLSQASGRPHSSSASVQPVSDDEQAAVPSKGSLAVLPIFTPKRAPSAATTATPSTGFSRLPRPSFAPVSRPLSTKKEQPTYSKAPSKRQEKPRVRLGPIPLGGRMTRSAALRQKESMKKESMAEVTTPKPVAGPSVPPSPALKFTPARPVPGAADLSNKPTPLHKGRSFSFSFAQPTASSVAKFTPTSPEKDKRRSGLPVPSTFGSSSKPLSAAAAESTPLNSSLSSLSLALQKLSMPTPSRPGTSMGFHPEPTEMSDNPFAEASTSKAALSRPTALHPRPASVAGGSVRAAPLQRAATVGDVPKTPAPSQPRQATLAFKPASSSRPPEAKKRITVHSGIVAGKPKGKLSIATSLAPTPGPSTSSSSPSLVPAAPRPVLRAGMLGIGAGRNRVFPRASKKSSLPVVEGSPVKNGADGGDADEEAVVVEGASMIEQAVEKEKAVSRSDSGGGAALSTVEGKTTLPPSDTTFASEEPAVNAVAAVAAKRDPSRRASLALHLYREAQLAQASQPQTPVTSSSKPEAGPSTASPALPKRHVPATRTFRQPPPPTAYRFNLRERPEPRSAPSVLKRSASASHVSGKGKRAVTGDEAEVEGTPSMRHGVLSDCTVCVDVRTDDGDDAGALFVDMLGDMGAKVLNRVGQTCTHVVFKNGLLSTLTRYRLLKEPRPLVVGIAWVVECAEQCKRVDEARFLISLDGVNVAGTQKRRRSMLPRQFQTLQSADADAQGAASLDAPSPNFVPRLFSPAMAATDAQRSSSPSVADTDEANRSGSSQTLLPLEKARQRRSVLPGS